MCNQVLHFAYTDRALGFSQPGKKGKSKDRDDETESPRRPTHDDVTIFLIGIVMAISLVTRL